MRITGLGKHSSLPSLIALASPNRTSSSALKSCERKVKSAVSSHDNNDNHDRIATIIMMMSVITITIGQLPPQTDDAWSYIAWISEWTLASDKKTLSLASGARRRPKGLPVIHPKPTSGTGHTV
jgi:hypothetical protein